MQLAQIGALSYEREHLNATRAILFPIFHYNGYLISGGFRGGRAPPPPPKIRKAYIIQR